MAILTNGLQHIGIPCSDIQISEHFYSKLGFQNVMQSDFEYKGGQGVAIMMQGHSFIIELYQMPPDELQEIKMRQNGRIDHFALDVDDIDNMLNELKDSKFKILTDTPVFLSFWKKGCKYIFIEGPDGERIEFNQIL